MLNSHTQQREMNASTRKKVQRKWNIRGCNLKVDVLDKILSFTCGFEGPDEAIDLLLDEDEAIIPQSSPPSPGINSNETIKVYRSGGADPDGEIVAARNLGHNQP